MFLDVKNVSRLCQIDLHVINLQFACNLRQNLRNPSHSIEDMTPNMDTKCFNIVTLE